LASSPSQTLYSHLQLDRPLWKTSSRLGRTLSSVAEISGPPLNAAPMHVQPASFTGNRDEWAELISHSFVPLTLGEAAAEFRGLVRQTILLPGITLSDVHTHGRSVVLRTERLVRREPREDYLFSLQLAGPGAVVQGDREVTLRPGTGALYSTARPYRLVFPASTREVVLQLPRSILREHLGDLGDLSGRSLPGDDPAVRVLTGFLRELVLAAPVVDSKRLAEFGWSAVDLIATALRATSGQDTAIGGRPGLLLAMRQYVAAHLADPDLTPSLLARRYAVSPRHVADLFAASGSSPAAFIRGERLKAADRLLRDPRQAHRPIAVIAAQCGFADRTTFTRAFVRRYGVTPAQVRAGGA
jgi:AraC-like DNA-binding protein